MNPLTYGVIVQARMNSVRLPGKSLADLCGTPSLGRLLDRLSLCTSEVRLVVATSVEPSDDPIDAYCDSRGIDCYRGPLDNVARRIRGATYRYRLDAFVRLSGDSPLFDGRILDEGILLFNEGGHDIVTNVRPRTFPKGQSYEIIHSLSFERAYEQFSTPEHYEHVTPWFYENSEQMRIGHISANDDYSDVNLCVDTTDDHARIVKLIETLGPDAATAGWQEIAELARSIS